MSWPKEKKIFMHITEEEVSWGGSSFPHGNVTGVL